MNTPVALLAALDAGIADHDQQQAAATQLRKLEAHAHDLTTRLQRGSDQHEVTKRLVHDVRNKAAEQLGATELVLLELLQAAEALRGHHPTLDHAASKARQVLDPA